VHRLARKAGVAPIRVHDLRHSAAGYLLSRGIPAHVAKEILGHTQIATTVDLYGHLLEAVTDDALAVMAKIVRPSA
jgi:integrase